jgi:hypothetical protein
MPPTPTRQHLEDALQLVLDHSLTQTQAAARIGLAYMTFRNRGYPTFRCGRELRVWLADLESA